MDELQLWENRKNDSFGTLLNHAHDITKEVLGYSYTDELGIKYSIIKNILIGYMLYGDVRFYNSARRSKYVTLDKRTRLQPYVTKENTLL